jgi:elongation factor P
MVLAAEVKEGTAIQHEGKLFEILEVVHHAGSAQMHGFVELKLKDLRFGHVADKRFKQSDKFETVNLAKRPMEFLYHDSENFVFMDPESFEQVSVPSSSVGPLAKFFKEGSMVTLELVGDEPIGIQFPKTVEMKISMTGPGIRDGQDNTMKPAILENGIEILVPQFIDTGDVIRLDTEKIKYIDRLTAKKL